MNRHRLTRSADWQSAVSPIGNRQPLMVEGSKISSIRAVMATPCRLPVGDTAVYQTALPPNNGVSTN